MDNNQTFLNACRNGQKSIVQIFLKKGGIDINKRDQEGNTALYYACQKGYRDIVALLLDNDADASCINNRSESPLHAAARSGNKEILGKLLQKGADINVTDNEGRTPLICLLDNKRTDAALFLMDQGADTEVADASGHKAIDYATAHGLREVVARLSCGNDRDARGNTPLHQAVYNGQGEIVRTLLLSDKSMLDSTNDGGETPLILACMQGNLVMVNLLLGTGADPGKAMLSGNAPIHYAAISGNRFIGEALLKAKAAVDAQNDNGKPRLFLQPRRATTILCPSCLNFTRMLASQTTSSTPPCTMQESAASTKSWKNFLKTERNKQVRYSLTNLILERYGRRNQEDTSDTRGNRKRSTGSGHESSTGTGASLVWQRTRI